MFGFINNPGSDNGGSGKKKKNYMIPLDDNGQDKKLCETAYDTLDGPMYEPNGNNATCRFVLCALESQYSKKTSKADTVPAPDDLHCEHILPQKFNKRQVWEGWSDDARSREVLRLGNLVLLRRKSESSRSPNKPFLDKMKFYFGDSKHKDDVGVCHEFNYLTKLRNFKNFRPEEFQIMAGLEGIREGGDEEEMAVAVRFYLRNWDIGRSSVGRGRAES